MASTNQTPRPQRFELSKAAARIEAGFPRHRARLPSAGSKPAPRAHRPLLRKQCAASVLRSGQPRQPLASGPTPARHTEPRIRHGSAPPQRTPEPIAATATQADRQTEPPTAPTTPSQDGAASAAEFRSPVSRPLSSSPLLRFDNE